MAELKTYRRRRREKQAEEEEQQQIDHIPKYFQQRRSPIGPKRRTDFSLFVCSSSSSLSKDILLESPSSKEILSSVTIASLDETKDIRSDILDLPQVRCIKPQDETEGLFPNCVEVPVIEVDSVDPKQSFEQWSNRNVDKQREDTLRTLDFSPDKSQTTESSDACTTPRSVVWAKKACEVWWPAEIVEKGSTSVGSSFQDFDGQVLVQYYGNQESAWIEPARDISQFEDGFEERSCNPMEEFQDALKQALNQKENPTSCKELSGSPDGPDCSIQQGQSTGDKCNSSSSSRTENDYIGRSGRSKRKIKPKLHFDDVTIPLKSTKRVRRLKIMRSLGLAAPVGSPFSPAPDDVFTSK